MSEGRQDTRPPAVIVLEAINNLATLCYQHSYGERVHEVTLGRHIFNAVLYEVARDQMEIRAYGRDPASFVISTSAGTITIKRK